MGINRRKFLGALSMVAGFFGLGPSVNGKEPKAQAPWPKLLGYVDVRGEIGWFMGFKWELTLSMTRPFQKDYLNNGVFGRELITHHFRSPKSNSHFLLKGIQFDTIPSGLIKFTKEDVSIEIDHTYNLDNYPFIVGVPDGKGMLLAQRSEGVVLEYCSYFSVSLKDHVVIPGDLHIVATAKIAEYQDLHTDGTVHEMDPCETCARLS